jgi:hypothetical protein
MPSVGSARRGLPAGRGQPPRRAHRRFRAANTALLLVLPVGLVGGVPGGLLLRRLRPGTVALLAQDGAAVELPGVMDPENDRRHSEEVPASGLGSVRCAPAQVRGPRVPRVHERRRRPGHVLVHVKRARHVHDRDPRHLLEEPRVRLGEQVVALARVGVAEASSISRELSGSENPP